MRDYELEFGRFKLPDEELEEAIELQTRRYFSIKLNKLISDNKGGSPKASYYQSRIDRIDEKRRRRAEAEEMTGRGKGQGTSSDAITKALHQLETDDDLLPLGEDHEQVEERGAGTKEKVRMEVEKAKSGKKVNAEKKQLADDITNALKRLDDTKLPPEESILDLTKMTQLVDVLELKVVVKGDDLRCILKALDVASKKREF